MSAPPIHTNDISILTQIVTFCTSPKIGHRWIYKQTVIRCKSILSARTDPPISIGGFTNERQKGMFDYEISQKSHFTGKDGDEVYTDWKRKMGLPLDGFPFRFKGEGYIKLNKDRYMNVVSWGFYQGSDRRYYVFITYRSNDNAYTCAYHWDVDEDGKPVGSPRKHGWRS
jgi:hypothetical protein